MSLETRRAKAVAIVGTNASGKSALGVAVALRFSGEIISADSRQVYRYLDIGTDKPELEIRRRVPHHMIDLVDLTTEFKVARMVSALLNA